MSRETKSLVPVIYLFTEGMTERDYLEQLGKMREVRIVKVKTDSSPAVLLESAVLFARRNAEELRGNSNAEIWVVFDYDGKQKEIVGCRDSLGKCLRACLAACSIKDFTRCGFRDVIGRIQVAYMAPCIELWGLICTKEGVDARKIPLDRHELQRSLHKVMPRYSHRSEPRFDLSRMTETSRAIARARSWMKTSGSFPECINASYYAGIAPLVEKILACRERIQGGNNDWRRRS
ncbi:MAG: RloB domain-containing protein [Kiritimatiellia bacterium]